MSLIVVCIFTRKGHELWIMDPAQTLEYIFECHKINQDPVLRSNALKNWDMDSLVLFFKKFLKIASI